MVNLPDVLAASWATLSATLLVIPIQLSHRLQSQESVPKDICSTKDNVTSVQETVLPARLQLQPVPDVKWDSTLTQLTQFVQLAQLGA